MRSDETAVEEARRMSIEIVQRHLPDPAYRIFLFGSRARGAAHEISDIDLGIEGPAPIPHETLASILADIEESPTLYTVDVVDFRRVPEDFRELAFRDAREIA